MPAVSRHPTPSSFHMVDVRALKRDGLLVPGMRITIRQRINGHVVRQAVGYVEDGGITMTAGSRPEFLAFDYSDAPLGGRITWFACPRCEGRAAILYGSPFACRPCWGITYPAQRTDAHGRATLKAQKLRIALGGTGSLIDPIPERPWGMWASTYRRKVERCRQADERTLAGLDALLARWRATTGRDSRVA